MIQEWHKDEHISAEGHGLVIVLHQSAGYSRIPCCHLTVLQTPDINPCSYLHVSYMYNIDFFSKTRHMKFTFCVYDLTFISGDGGDGG